MNGQLLFNSQSLAQKIGRSPWYVWAMKRAGFRFSHGTRCDLETALAWLAENPDFRAHHLVKRRPAVGSSASTTATTGATRSS